MANERAWTYRNTGTPETPVWEKWFQKTVADAVYVTDERGEPTDKNIVTLMEEKIADLIGGAPGTFDTLKEIADYIAKHEDVAKALNEAITNKAEKNHTHPVANQSTAGMMDPKDKKKLDGVADGATANDTKYKNQTPSTVAVGGIPKGYVPPVSGVEAIDMLDKLLHAYVSPSATAAAKPINGGVFELGTSQTVTSVDVNITLGSTGIKKIEVLDSSSVLGSKDSGIAGGVNTITLSKTLTVNANKQLSVKITDNEDKSITVKTGSFTFVRPYYYGSIAAGATPTEELIKAATKSVTTKGTKTFTYNCTDQKMLLAYPKEYGVLKKILDPNNFDVTDTFTRTEVTVDGVVYYAYANTASTVSNFKMTFNY